MHVPKMTDIYDAFVRAMAMKKYFEPHCGSPAKTSREEATKGKQSKAIQKRRAKNRMASQSRRINRLRAA
jgi:hypothetical protein